MKTFKFFIPKRLPGLNEIIKWSKTPVPWLCKGNRKVFKYTLQKKEIEYDIRGFILLQGRNIFKFDHCRINFKWYEPNQRRDPSNVCAGGRKFILDALVSSGVLKNDNWMVSDFTDTFFVNKSNPGVQVEITSIIAE